MANLLEPAIEITMLIYILDNIRQNNIKLYTLLILKLQF